MKKPTLTFYRRLFQLFVAVIFIIVPILNRSDYSAVYGNFLSLHAFGIPLADPLAVLQLTVKNFYLTLDNFIGTLLPLLLAFFLGTVFCSWVCPYGLFSEWTQNLSKRILPKSFKGLPVTRNGFPLKLVVFVVGFILFFIFSTTPILNQLSTAAWYARFFQYLFGQDIISWCFLFLLALLAVEFFAQKRLWCKYVCPQSILIILTKNLNKKRLKIGFDEEKCICKPGYERCEMACHLTLNPKQVNIPREMECSNCGSCVVACNRMGNALSFQFPYGEQYQLGQKLKKLLPGRAVLLKTGIALLVVAGLGTGTYFSVQNIMLSDSRPEIKSALLADKKISWHNSKAEYFELLADGTLICVGGDWPTEGFKGWQWQPVGDNGSFKIIRHSTNPEESEYTIVRVDGKLTGSSHVTLENSHNKEGEVKEVEAGTSEQQTIGIYETLQNNHLEQATSMDSRVILNRYADEVYILDLKVFDQGGKKIKKVLSEGDLITTEGMLTAVHKWINSPVITASEGSPPALPIHTRMELRYHDGRTKKISFITTKSVDRTSEVFEDLWF